MVVWAAYYCTFLVVAVPIVAYSTLVMGVMSLISVSHHLIKRVCACRLPKPSPRPHKSLFYTWSFPRPPAKDNNGIQETNWLSLTSRLLTVISWSKDAVQELGPLFSSNLNLSAVLRNRRSFPFVRSSGSSDPLKNPVRSTLLNPRGDFNLTYILCQALSRFADTPKYLVEHHLFTLNFLLPLQNDKLGVFYFARLRLT